jgi:hypothetical protein
VTTDAISEIAKLRTQASELIEVLGRQPIPDHDDAALAARDVVLRLANELHQAAREPITLGFVGEFSSGKSMLLGTLLGWPGLLPTQLRPTTGNVTALHLLPGDPGLGTSFEGEATVAYMSRHELAECVRYMLDRFAARFTETFPGTDVSLLLDRDPVNEGWRELEAWCRAKLWGGTTRSPDLRQIAAELMAIRDAQTCAANLLGQDVPVPDEMIRQALDLGDERPVPEEFPERTFRPSVGKSSIVRGKDDLRATFPLIKRVTYEVRVDPVVWRLDGLRDENEVVLLDFPGLTAGRSALRDEYLSRNELHNIHTITVIIDARKPGTEVPFKFYAMMERKDRYDVGRDSDELRDSILVVGNRFDLITPPGTPTAGALGIGELRRQSQQFDGLCVKASDLVAHHDDKIRLTSSIAAMSLSGYLGRYTGEGTDEEGGHVRAAVAEASPGIAAWGTIADRLNAVEKKGPWGAALAEYAADGGMAGVRMLIEQHARDHGIENKLRGMRRTRERMWAALRPLARMVAAREPAPTVDQQAQQRIRELLEDFRSRHRRVAEAFREMADPMELTWPDRSTPLVTRAREDAVMNVMRWWEWQLILRRSQKGFIVKSEGNASDFGDPEEEWEDLEGPFGPGNVGDETTATFLPPYRKELADAVRRGRTALGEWLQDWLQRQNDQLGDLGERFTDPEIRRLLEPALARISRDFGGADLMGVLEGLTDLSWLGDQITKVTTVPMPQDEIDRGYPLYVDHALPWHSLVPERPEDSGDEYHRHQFYVFRLQRQLAIGIADTLTQQLADDLVGLRNGLNRRLQRYWRAIPDAAYLRIMFPPEPPAGTSPAGPDGDGPAGPSPLLDFIAKWEGR